MVKYSFFFPGFDVDMEEEHRRKVLLQLWVVCQLSELRTILYKIETYSFIALTCEFMRIFGEKGAFWRVFLMYPIGCKLILDVGFME